MAKHCTYCGIDIPTGQKICPNCGRVVQGTPDNVSQEQNAYPLPLKETAQTYEDYYAEKPLTHAKKRVQIIVCVAIALIIVVLLTGTGIYFYVNQPSPTKTLTAYCNALKTDNYQAAYNLFSPSYQGPGRLDYSESGYATYIQSTFTSAGGLKTCSTSNVTENGSQTNAELVYSFGNGFKLPGYVKLVNENGSWKIDNILYGTVSKILRRPASIENFT